MQAAYYFDSGKGTRKCNIPLSDMLPAAEDRIFNAMLRQRGGHIYFSSITRIRKEQEKSLLAREHAVAAEFPLANAVALLIEKIRNPVLEAGALAALLRGRGVILTEQEVYGFLSFHGLAKKK